MEKKKTISLKHEALNLPLTEKRTKILSDTQRKFQRQKRALSMIIGISPGWKSSKTEQQ